MSYIEITKFCANKHEVRTGLHHPYRIGQWVYATNGHMIVRVPSESAPHIPERDKTSQPSANGLYDGAAMAFSPEQHFCTTVSTSTRMEFWLS